MNSNVAIPRSVIIYGLCVPLAMLMGYLLTTPLDMTSVIGVGTVLCLLMVPVLLRWHHFLLLVSWNATVNAFFLPGQPRFWMLMTVASIAFSILQRIMNKELRLQNVGFLTIPLVFLGLVIIITAELRGGIGLRSLGGSSFGGKKYFEALFAILGFFAISWQRIPPAKTILYTGLYFLSGITNAVSNLAYASGIYWLFWLFPIDSAVAQIQSDYSLSDRAFSRLVGVAFACIAPFCFLLVRHGVREIFEFGSNWSFLPFRSGKGLYMYQPYRFLLFVIAVALCPFGGFRSMPILFAMIFMIHGMLEGIYKTRLCYIILGLGLLVGAALLPFTDKLPMVVQRAICFLPVKVNPLVKVDAWASTDWRLRMWNLVADQIPNYFWLGKGYAGNTADLYLARESIRRGYLNDFEISYLSGDYHSGPLSVQVPLGVFGSIGFLWFLGAGAFALYRNYRYSTPELKNVNRFLLAFFVAEVIFYMAVFGSFTSSLYIFTGTVGLSVSLNAGVMRATQSVRRQQVPQPFRGPGRPGILPGPNPSGAGALA